MSCKVETPFISSFGIPQREAEVQDISHKEIPFGLGAQTMSSISPASKDISLGAIIKPEKKQNFVVPDFIYIELMEALYSIGKELFGTADFEIGVLCDKLHKHMKSSAEIMKQVSDRSKEFGLFQMLEKIGLCLIGAFNFLFGGAAIASGSPVLGSTLMAAAVLSTANLVMTEMHGWDYMAKKASYGDKKLEEDLRCYLPIASTVVSAALTAGTSSLGIYSNVWQNIDLSTKSLEGVQKALLTYSTFSSSGKMFTEGRQQFVRADLDKVQNKIEEETFYKDLLTSWLTEFLENIGSTLESTKTIIQLGTQKR